MTVKSLIKTAMCIAAAGAMALCTACSESPDTSSTETSESEEQIELLTELKVGKYYRENGTEDEYIEVFEDGRIQFMGFDYFDTVLEMNPDYKSLSEEELAEIRKEYEEEINYWNEAHYYVLDKRAPLIGFSDTPVDSEKYPEVNAVWYSYSDENTIFLEEGSSYIYHYRE